MHEENYFKTVSKRKEFESLVELSRPSQFSYGSMETESFFYNRCTFILVLYGTGSICNVNVPVT